MAGPKLNDHLLCRRMADKAKEDANYKVRLQELAKGPAGRTQLNITIEKEMGRMREIITQEVASKDGVSTGEQPSEEASRPANLDIILRALGSRPTGG